MVGRPGDWDFPTSDEQLEIDGAIDDDDGRECSWCGGEGYDECDDPIGCLSPHLRDGSCLCGACGGSGLAKDQTIW
jgi:hypothetical protein